MNLRELSPPAHDELLVVVGPTASGKTDLAIALARRFDGEIVSADSVQIYQRFDVGSGKPSAEERAQARHHLVDAIDPLAPMDAGRFAELADAAIRDIRARRKQPIVCGGTFLWIKALLFGLAEAAPRDEAVRARHEQLAQERGRPYLHGLLVRVDPESAARLAPNDLVRVSRALEVHELTGRPLSAWQREHAFAEVRHRHRLLGVKRERAELDLRIERRALAWLEGGWCEEVKGLLAAGYAPARAMGSVGYREVRSHLEGALTASALLPAIVRSTRVFVRRQRTWLRDQDVAWLEPGAPSAGA